MPGTNKITTDHDEIRRWTEERGGFPATVKGTEAGDEEAGVLRIDFPDYTGQETLEPIDWDEFFRKFDEANLAMVYQEKTSTGATSRFCKLVDRASVEAQRRSA
jgi:hypothetical protein